MKRFETSTWGFQTLLGKKHKIYFPNTSEAYWKEKISKVPREYSFAVCSIMCLLGFPPINILETHRPGEVFSLSNDTSLS